MSDKLVALRQQVNPRLPQPSGLLQQYEALSAHFNQRAAYKEKALAQRGLTVQAGEHSEQILPAGEPGSMTAGRWLAAALSCWKSCAGARLAMPVVWRIVMWRPC